MSAETIKRIFQTLSWALRTHYLDYHVILFLSVSNKLSSFLKKMATSRPQKVVLPVGGRKLEYAEVKNTCSSCLLYRRALTIFTKQLQLEMLTGAQRLHCVCAFSYRRILWKGVGTESFWTNRGCVSFGIGGKLFCCVNVMFWKLDGFDRNWFTTVCIKRPTKMF